MSSTSLFDKLKSIRNCNTTEDACLINADCQTVLTEIPKKSVNVVIIDPPYGAQTQGNNEWDIAWSASKWQVIVEEVFRVLKPGGHFVVFSGGKTLFDIHYKVTDAYKNVCKEDPSFYHMIWKHDSNDSCTTHSHIPRSQFEDIMVYFRTGEGKIMEKNGCLTQTDRFYHHTGRSNVIHAYKDDDRSKTENTIKDFFKQMDAKIGSGGKVSTFDMKPEQLMMHLVRDYSNEGGVVLDFCARHMITGVAALTLKRKFIGVELEKEAFQRGLQRLQDRFNITFASDLMFECECGCKYGICTGCECESHAIDVLTCEELLYLITLHGGKTRTGFTSKRNYLYKKIHDMQITEHAFKLVQQKSSTSLSLCNDITPLPNKKRVRVFGKKQQFDVPNDDDNDYVSVSDRSSRNKKQKLEFDDPLNIVGKIVDFGTSKNVTKLRVIEVEPSFEKKGARYTVEYLDSGKRISMLILPDRLQSVSESPPSKRTGKGKGRVAAV